MSQVKSLKPLLAHPALWQASAKQAPPPVHSTGFAELDRQLHYGGWPQGRLCELLLAQPGMGEWRLLAPLLTALANGPGYVVLVNPPLLPYAPGLAALGLNLDKCVCLQLPDLRAQIWSAYQAISSGACSVLLCWLPCRQIITSELRKLALASREAHCWTFVVRPLALSQQSSVAALRLSLQLHRDHCSELTIIKQPGGWSGQSLRLPLYPESKLLTTLAAQYWPACSSVLSGDLPATYGDSVARQTEVASRLDSARRKEKESRLEAQPLLTSVSLH